MHETPYDVTILIFREYENVFFLTAKLRHGIFSVSKFDYAEP